MRRYYRGRNIAGPDPRNYMHVLVSFSFIFLGSQSVSNSNKLFCFSGMQVIRTIHVRQIKLAQDFVTWRICKILAPGAVRRGRMEPSQAKSLCWRTRLKVHMLVSRVILYRHEKILLKQERLQAQTQDTICTCWSVSHWHLWITVFVWPYALCGTKKSCSASVDCSGVIG